MSVRKRIWKGKGGISETWVVDYQDIHGVRRLKTFSRKKDADVYHACVKGGVVPPRPNRPIHADALTFTVPLNLVRRRAYKDSKGWKIAG